MKVYDKLLKPIKEVNYLRADNVDRYRLIIRYFFLEYEKIHYWIHKEEVYEEIRQIIKVKIRLPKLLQISGYTLH